jgi:ParB/RepB/Spo0J family partition protein
MLTNKYKRLRLDEITVDREKRQRRDVDVSDLVESISRRGVIHPVVVEVKDGQNMLVSGERRYLTSKLLNLPDIPVRFAHDLSEQERQIIELEENLKRKDLPWQDECAAVLRIHKIYCEIEHDWTLEKTATELSIAVGTVSIMRRVGEELAEGNPKIAGATSYRQAYNIVARADSRKVDDAMSDIIAGIGRPQVPQQVTTAIPGASAEAPKQTLSIIPPEQSIHTLDFLTFADNYTGKPFNFIHCDFPYGVGMNKSAQGNVKQWGSYEDSPDTYWRLCACLARNVDRLMTQSAHLMFWFSMEYYEETLAFFAENAPTLEFQKFPLIWYKSDNKGILPDHNRGPRRVYETAFIASRNDRFIVRPVSNCYPSPAAKEDHQSEKAEPMLAHFFQMFVDENTRLLDPTCGSGTSLRAAERLGASQVYGLEINPEYAENAKTRLRQTRVLRAAEGLKKPA